MYLRIWTFAFVIFRGCLIMFKSFFQLVLKIRKRIKTCPNIIIPRGKNTIMLIVVIERSWKLNPLLSNFCEYFSFVIARLNSGNCYCTYLALQCLSHIFFVLSSNAESTVVGVDFDGLGKEIDWIYHRRVRSLISIAKINTIVGTHLIHLFFWGYWKHWRIE